MTSDGVNDVPEPWLQPEHTGPGFIITRARHRLDGHEPQRRGLPAGPHQRALPRGKERPLRSNVRFSRNLKPGTMDTSGQ